MKEWKDYAPFYLGCEMLYIGTGRPIKGLGKKAVLTIQNFEVLLFSNQRKPILRKLSDMTEEEKTMAGGRWKESKIGYEMETKIGADKTVYLLSKHFDLFSLIDAGLAIDKNTILKNDEL